MHVGVLLPCGAILPDRASAFYRKCSMQALSAQSIVFLALCSACTRAGLNIVDRYLIGKRRMSITVVSCVNNIGPALAMLLLSVALTATADTAATGAATTAATTAATALLMANTSRLIGSLWSANPQHGPFLLGLTLALSCNGARVQGAGDARVAWTARVNAEGRSGGQIR